MDKNDYNYVIERFGKPTAFSASYNSSIFLIDNKLVRVFHIKPVYYLNRQHIWRPLSEVTNYLGNKTLEFNNYWEEIAPEYLRFLLQRNKLINGNVLIPSPYGARRIREGHEIHFTTSTNYPDAHPETTTVDGTTNNDGVSANWATIRARAGSGAIDNGATIICGYIHYVSGGWDRIDRGFFLFDTSDIGAGSTIDSGTFSLYGSAKTDSANFNQAVVMINTDPASNTELATGDHYRNSKIAGAGTDQASATIDIGSINNSDYNDFTLSATGEASVSKTGVTKFGTALNGDQTNTEPTPAETDTSSVTVIGADTAGTNTDPKLAVVYISSGGAVFMGTEF